MFADYAALLEYLLDRGLVERTRIVENDLTVLDASRRNCNLKVLSEDGPSYFLKQDVKSSVGGERDYASVGYEAAIYELFAMHSGKEGFGRYLPRFYTFDAKRRLLILEAVVGAESLAVRYTSPGAVPSEIADELGRFLATLHDGYVDNLGPWKALTDRRGPPWSTLFPEPSEWTFLNVSGAVLDFLRMVQESSALCGHLEALRSRWSSTSLIHGDIKWDNCLLLRQGEPESSAAPEIKIVDWELATIGDPAWDVGTVFGEYLNAWVSSVPIRSATAPEQFLEFATAPLHEMHRSIRSFWFAYTDASSDALESGGATLLDACRNTGARLIQTACEELQDRVKVTAKAVAQLQLAENILDRPREAAVRLLGIPLESH